MTDPISFPSTTARLGLPTLFVGQSQKEFFINEAFARIDSLLHGTILGESAAPAANPTEGDAWLIGASPTGGWADREGQIAAYQAGDWIYTAPFDGMRLYDRSTGGTIFFKTSWQRIAPPGAPVGGTTIDSEARVAIVNLIETLASAGIFPAS